MGKMIHALMLVLSAAAVGCSSDDKPHKHGKERPPLDEIDAGGRGLQSKDLIQATDQMAMELLALPELNASQHQWTIVTGPTENQTQNVRQNYAIFIDRLKTNISKQGRGRVTLIENRDRYRDLQSKELETGEREDTFGQTDGSRVAPGPAGIQPDYILYCKAQQMTSGGPDLYRFEFNLTGLKTRQLIWSGEYMVKVH